MVRTAWTPYAYFHSLTGLCALQTTCLFQNELIFPPTSAWIYADDSFQPWSRRKQYSLMNNILVEQVNNVQGHVWKGHCALWQHHISQTSVRHARDGINARKIAILRTTFLSLCTQRFSQDKGLRQRCALCLFINWLTDKGIFTFFIQILTFRRINLSCILQWPLEYQKWHLHNLTTAVSVFWTRCHSTKWYSTKIIFFFPSALAVLLLVCLDLPHLSPKHLSKVCFKISK